MNWSLFDDQREMFPVYVEPEIGFTLLEYQEKYGITRNVAQRQLVELLRVKHIVYVGVRKGSRAGTKVYDVVSEKGKRAKNRRS